MRANQIPSFLEEQRTQATEEFQTTFLEFEDFWERKLWHPLTEALIAYFNLPASAAQRLPMFREFVLSFADKINQLKLVELGLMASKGCADDQERLSFLSSLADTVNKDSSQDAYVYALVDVAAVKLRLGDTEGSRKDLDKCQDSLDKFDSVDTAVYAEFYEVNAEYYQALADFTSYYRTALLYLSCVSLDDMPADARLRRAYNLSIAALVSDSIYNFGELLLHPILATLQQSRDHAWLVDLLFAFNNGDTTAYSILVTNMHKESSLEANKTLLQQKISLAALTDAVFQRPSHDRSMSFATIQQSTSVQPGDVELLVMKALSLGLIKGTIDQVAQVVNVTWVQPKVLDMKQVDGMRQRLQEWDGGLNRLGHWIERTGGDVWAA